MQHWSLNGPWEFRQGGHDEWLPAQVPGCNFTDLMRNERIEDPFYRDNEKKLQWIEHEHWEYRKTFRVTAEQLAYSDLHLVADGLDTFCDIYLNGKHIGESHNMFIGHRIACKGALQEGENTLEIRFRSPIKETYPLYEKAGYSYPAENDKSDEKLSVYCRKAGCHFGWDWGPRFVTSGIWRDIYIEAVDSARIDDLAFTQHQLSDTQADFSFECDIQATQALSNATLRLVCDEASEVNQTLTLSAAAGSSTQSRFDLTLNNPKRWWPNGLGEPNLYHFSVELVSADQTVLSRMEKAIGFRTIEVVNQPDEMGESFFVKVNGQPVFMKGANYIPDDSFLDRVTEETHRKTIESAVYANMNMLRVWGGGIYQDNRFYELCDEYGLLVWQDFMFACTLYPAYPEFIANVKAEAEYNVRRLRHHACIALWCGNNEVEMGIADWGWPKTFGYSEERYDFLKQEYQTLFAECLPSVIDALDPQRFYLRSSPMSFWENGKSDHIGNHHYWGVWHGEEPFSEYQKRIPRFMTEYGFQSFPMPESVAKYTEADDLTLESPVMQVHQKHPRGNKLIRSYMEDEFKNPKDFDQLLYLGQVQQALGLKLAFEAHRGAMPFCMGTLYWQLNDTWPAASWSGIDYYGRWKALHYQARRSFRQQLLVVTQQEKQVKVQLVSDDWQSIEGYLELALKDFSGKTLWTHTKAVEALPNAQHTVFELDEIALLGGHSAQTVALEARFISNDGECLTDALHFLVPNKALTLKQPTIQTGLAIDGNVLAVTLTTDTLARQVYLNLPLTPHNFSDNFFDLMPGESKEVRIELPESQMNLESIQAQLVCWSLFDSFNDADSFSNDADAS